MPARAWEPRTWHRYQYAYASPISYYDPYGAQTCGFNILTGERECFGERTGMGWTPTLGWTPLPTVLLPEGAMAENCLTSVSISSLHFIASGVVSGRVFIGEPLWVIPETDPHPKLAPGWLGRIQGLLDLFLTFFEPYARAHYIETQPPNVEVQVAYTYYWEGLALEELRLRSQAQTPLKLGWLLQEEEESQWVLKPETVLKIERRLPPESVTFTVWLLAPFLEPPQYRELQFVFPSPFTSPLVPYVK